MTTTALHAALDALGWSPAELADILRVGRRTVRRWMNGTAPVPPNIARWLETTVELIATSPP